MNIYKAAAATELSPRIKDLYSKYVDQIIKGGGNPLEVFEDQFAPAMSAVFNSLFAKLDEMEEDPDKEDLLEMLADEIEDHTAGNDLLGLAILSIIKEYGVDKFLMAARNLESLLESLREYTSVLSARVIPPKEVATTPPKAPDEIEAGGEEDLEDAREKIMESERLPFQDRINYIIEEFSIKQLDKYLSGLSFNRKSEFGEDYPTPEVVKSLIKMCKNHHKNYMRNDYPSAKRQLTMIIGKLLLYSFGKSVVVTKDIEEYIEEKKKEQAVEVATESEKSETPPSKMEEEEEEETFAEEEDANNEVVANSSRITSSSDAFKNKELFNENSQSRVAAQKLSGFFKSPFIDFHNGPITSLEELESMNVPRLDTEALDNFISVSTGKVYRLYDIVEQSARSRQKESNSSIIRELNDLVYTIKVADLDTYNSIISYQNKIAEFEDSEAKIKQLDRIRNIKDSFEKNCMSAAIFQDRAALFEAPGTEKISDALFRIVMITSSPIVAKVYFAHKLKATNMSKEIEDLIQNILNKKNYSVRTEDISEIATKSAEEALSTFNNHLSRFFRLNYDVNISNFISQANLRFDFLLNQALQRVYTIKSDYTLSPCPVCFKLIPTSFSSETKQADKGFTVCVVSPFREDRRTKDLFPITEDELSDQNRRFKISNSYKEKFYSSQDEYFYIAELIKNDQSTGGSTWSQIQTLLSSSKISDQREGWHRRANAFLDLGAKQISSFRKITDILVQCPAKPVLNSSGNNKGDGSYCGLKVTPIQSGSLSSRLSYQTQFSGKARSINSEDIAALTPDPSGWSEGSYQVAQNSVRAGFKFSAVSFACPCRIKNPDASAALMHRNVVISKTGPAGSPGFIPPTKPDGSLDNEIAPGTLSFMVCSAPTSLSSFNKNEADGEKYILETLLSTAESSPQDYYKFLNYLVYNGLDPQDIMAIDSDVKRYDKEKRSKEQQVKTSVLHPGSTARQRMQKISSLIALAAKDIRPKKVLGIADSNLFEQTLGNLCLVCPFGHKFKIGDSLRFGGAYSALYNSNVATKYSKLILTEGPDNANAVVESQILRAKPRGFYEDAWSSEETYDSKISIKKRIITGKVNIVDVEGQKDEEGRSSGGGLENIANPDFDEEDARNANIDGNVGVVKEGGQLPGTDFFNGKKIDYRTDRAGKDAFIKITSPKFSRLIEIIKKTILVIETYTSGIISDSNALINALNSGTLTYEEVYDNIKSKYKETISIAFREVIQSGMERFDLPENLKSIMMEKFIDNVMQEVSKEMLRVTSYLMSVVAETGGRGLVDGRNIPNLDKSISIKILAAAIGNVIGKEDEIIPGEDLVYADLIDVEDQDAFSQKMAASIASRNNFINYIVRDSLFKAKQGYEHAFGSRLVAVSYAINCAKLLSSLYNKFFYSDDQFNYLGFDLGVDLSMDSSLIRTEGDTSIYNLTSKMPSILNDVLNRQSNAFPKKATNADSYPMRMDRFYFELINRLDIIKSSSSSPNSLLVAKQYIDARITSEFGSDKRRAEEMMKKLSSFIPFVTTRLVTDHNNENSESFSYRRSPTRERIPSYTDVYNFEEDFKIIAAYVIVPVSRKAGVTKLRPRLPKFTANTAQEAEAAVEQGRRKLDELFLNLQNNPEFAEGVKKFNFSRADCDYEILRDDYIVSKDKRPQVAKIKVGSNTVVPERIVDTISEFSGNITPGTSLVFEVVNCSSRNFTIIHRNISGESVPMNIAKMEYGPVCNSYFVTATASAAISSPARFEVSIPLSPSGEIPSFNKNLNNSKVQIGATKRKVKDRTIWPELPGEDEDWSHIWAQKYKTEKLGFTNQWSYVGIILPIPDQNYASNKANVNKGRDIPVLDYKFVVKFEGSNLDITPLMLRGRQDIFPGEKEEAARIEQERKKAQVTGAKKLRELIAGDIGKIKELEDKIIATKEYIEEETNPDKIAEKTKLLESLIEQVKSFDIRFDTTASFIHFEPQKGFPKPSNGEYFAAPDLYPTLAPYIVNPYHAFRIIKNPEIAAAKIDDIDKERLKKFVTKIYNLQPIIDYLNLTFDIHATGEDLFDDTKLSIFNEKVIAKNPKLKSKGIIGVINSFIKDKNWLNEPGEYFDIVSAPQNSEDGSYIQFIFDASTTTDPGQCPEIKNFINAAERTTDEIQMFRGPGRSKLTTISNTLHENTTKYIKDFKTRPEARIIEEDENEALDPLSNSSKDSKKKDVRRFKLKGMINYVEDKAHAEKILLRNIP